MGKDRTKEFFTFVQQYQQQNDHTNTNGISPLTAVADATMAGKFSKFNQTSSTNVNNRGYYPGNNTSTAMVPYSSFTPSSFTKAAAEVSKDLQLTSRKISELTQCKY